MPHHIEIDQSGRTDRLNEDTALAFSNKIRRSILLTAAVKRACYQRLRERKLSKKVAVVTMIAAGLVILLRDQVGALESICIDLEYPGWEGEILQVLFRRLPWLRRSEIRFASIGKQSRAHDLAWNTFRREILPHKKVGMDELLRAC
ncbi:MAG: hypothetical protein HY782_24930 [Chloroflexi bacterium]|nr:hypothetical protein [Chloroflexota bacterium]